MGYQSIFFSFYYIGSLGFGEQIPVNDGLGWDGTIYAEMARLHTKELFNHYNSYLVQRILTPMIIHRIASVAHIDLMVTKNLLSVFLLYNYCLIMGCVYLLFRIGARLNWSSNTKYLCTGLLLFNFAVLKMNTYYPVLTDPSGMFMGMLGAYFYIDRNRLGLWITALLGSFVFPSLIYNFACLFLFAFEGREKPSIRQSNGAIALIVALMVCCWCLHCLFPLPEFASRFTSVDWRLLPLSLMALGAYVFYGLRYSLTPLEMLREFLKNFNVNAALLFVILWVVVKLTINGIASDAPPNMDLNRYIHAAPITAVVEPGISIALHIFYFGLAPVLMLLFWRQINQKAIEFGLGCVLFLLVTVIFSICSESRQIITAFPMFLILLGSVLNRYRISWPVTITLILMNLIFSRFWFSLSKSVSLFFMNIGPWVTHSQYFVIVGFDLVILLIVGFLFRKYVFSEVRSLPYEKQNYSQVVFEIR